MATGVIFNRIPPGVVRSGEGGVVSGGLVGPDDDCSIAGSGGRTIPVPIRNVADSITSVISVTRNSD